MESANNYWLKGGGTMAEQIRRKDWSETVIGAIDEWPPVLKSAVNIIIENNIPQAVCWGSQHLMIYNDAYQSLLNQGAEALGKPLFEVWSEVSDLILLPVKQTWEGKASYIENVRLKIERNGNLKQMWFDLSYSPLRDEEGNVAGILNTVVETTREMRNWQALRLSEEQYRNLFDSIDEGFCIIEVIFDDNQQPYDFIFLEVNPAFEEQSGLSDVKGKRRREIGDELEPYWFEIYGKVALTRESIRIEQPVRALGKYYDLYAFPFGKSENNRVAILFQDITERRESERTDALLSAIIENSDDAIISKDLEGVITSWNKSAERMFGYSSEEAIGQPITLIIPQNRLEEENQILSMIRSGKQVDHLETIRERKNSTLLEIAVTISPIRGGKGKIVGASSIARNITQRKLIEAQRDMLLQEIKTERERLEERVKERTRALQSLASELSRAEESERQRLASELHNNLGQILAVCKLRLDTLNKMELPNQASTEIEDVLTCIDEAILHTRELMSDLKPPPVFDGESLQEVLEWVAQKMKKHGLEVILKDDGQAKPLAEQSRTTLRRAVRELLFNVIKHSGVKKAWIALSRHENKIRVIVEDKGKGFQLSEEKLKPTEEGGFGLFNISERIDLLGGQFDIFTEPQKGTRAVITMPAEEQQVKQSGKKTESAQESVTVYHSKRSNNIVTILLVDDHQMVRKGLRKMIDEHDVLEIIAEASDGKQAVELACQYNPDVVIMDIDMPEMGGIEATKEIMAKQPGIRVIGLSLHDNKEVAERMRRAGASAYLTKTEAFESLSSTIVGQSSAFGK